MPKRFGPTNTIGNKRFIIGVITKINNVIYFLNNSFYYIIKKSFNYINFKYSHGPPLNLL